VSICPGILLSIPFPVIEIHGNAKSRGAGGPAEKNLGLPASRQVRLPLWSLFSHHEIGDASGIIFTPNMVDPNKWPLSHRHHG
jgi:hypothetical protein